MKTRTKIPNRLISLLLCLAVLSTCLPLTVLAADSGNTAFNREVDANTMDGWQDYFDLENLDTSNAGGVWTDKSVFPNADAFPDSINMIDDGKNFLTALSAIAANKEVIGYSTVPTDTVFVLDLSNSMSVSSMTQLIEATNQAINTLQGINNNNRVGVVLYSGKSANRTYSTAVSRLMPIDRYTTTDRNGAFINYSSDNVWVDETKVSGTKANIEFQTKQHDGATYIQAGLWEAYKMFNEVPDSEVIIGGNNWQRGEYRMPIVVLMSDGAPTLGASKYDDVENQTYGNNSFGADVGDGNDTGITAGQGFLVQLTASYIKTQIENKYKVKDENGAGQSLFYTLGFNISNDNNPDTVTSGDIAYSVLNPNGSNITDAMWSTYNDSNSNTMQVTVESRTSNRTTNVTITKNSYVTNKNYVDEYYSASGDGLSGAFIEIVNEIVLQSRYYPTHLEGGNPDFSGYVEFTDTLGQYMEVKHINGILLGNTLFDGHMMASKFADTSSSGLGTVENPTELGDEFIRSVKTRLGIANTADAQLLVSKAFADGQLKYNGENDWSNYIAWYADVDNNYLGFYDEDKTEPVPADAVYINRSYGFLGATDGHIRSSDMMHVSVQVKTNIQTRMQTVSWKIPAALIPMITYEVALQGINVDLASDVKLTVKDADKISPIRLIYETGLRSDINEFNVTSIMGDIVTDSPKNDKNHIDKDGYTRLFWNNSFDISAPSHDQHITAISEFVPNKENERFYYTFDSAVYTKQGSSYVFVSTDETLNPDGEYYHRRYVFKEGVSKPEFFYEPMSKESILSAKIVENFETLDHQTTGAWVVPKGTPARELQMYDRQKEENLTRSAHMVFHPYISEQNNFVYVDMNLGNNGLLSVTPATGLKISKTVDVFETGTSDTFKFRITLSKSGSFDYWITDLDKIPSADPQKANFTNGVFEFEMKKDQTFWLSGISAGTDYAVEEIPFNADYKIKSVQINGVSAQDVASGTITQSLIEDIDFENTAIGEGNLTVTKQVVDKDSNSVDISDSVKFTAEIYLTDALGTALSGTFESSDGNITLENGKYTATIAEGESFVIRNLPEETRFFVTEKNIPSGFTLNGEKSSLSGKINSEQNNQAIIFNTYEPVSVSGEDIGIDIIKEITGNRTNWLIGENYSFNIEKLTDLTSNGTLLDSVTIHYNDTDKTHLFRLSGENFTKAGIYYYCVTEQQGTQGGVTYDTAKHIFSVEVSDTDMNGSLEIVSVKNEMNTSVEGNWTVSARFNNIYAPKGVATATINIKKEIGQNYALSGYQFALYDSNPATNSGANEVTRSNLTNSQGQAVITLNYPASEVGKTFNYFLAEINSGKIINNIKYSDKVYPVTVTVIDNLDGTVSANLQISGLAQGTTTPTFVNEYIPSASDFVTISGKKEIIGDRILNANEFEFKLTPVTAGAPMPADDTVKNLASGSFSFGAIEFKDAHKGQTFVYTVTELDEHKIGGFTSYDNSVYTVTVTVVDNGNQTLTATAVTTKNSSAVSDIVFENTYDATDAEVTLKGTKILEGKTLQANEFEFKLTAVTSGAPMPQSSLAKNASNGEFAFGKITFSKAGTYVYNVTEVNGGILNYGYDSSVYTVTITVTDNAQGLLSAKVELLKNDYLASQIVFKNTFVPTPISYNDLYTDFGGTKILEGRNMSPGEFAFALINESNGQQIGEYVLNNSNGNFKFPPITLSGPGSYGFKIVEENGILLGVTYDRTSYHIRLEVVQDDNGILSISDKQLIKGTPVKQDIGGVLTEVISYENITDSGKIVFTNTYSAKPVNLTLEATKVLTGRDLVDGEFKFDLHKTDSTFAYSSSTLVQNDVVLTLNPDKTGRITFTEQEFDKEGIYYYVILEDEQSEKGITVDQTEYKVQISVVDDLIGNLKISDIKVNGNTVSGDIFDSVVFRNTYEAAATGIVIKGTKTLNGRDLKDGEFSFELYSQSGQKIETVKNAQNGSFEFSEIPVQQAGEYTYTVRELKGEAEGITYDSAVYTVKVTVTDNLDGTFKVEYDYLKGTKTEESIIFVNAYAEPVVPEIPETGDNTNILLWIALLLVSGAGVITTTVYTVKRKSKEK